jgi:hypothetical protein
MKNIIVIGKSLTAVFAGSLLVAALTFISIYAIGCATVSPTSDPIVVHAEQVETSADAAFQLVVDLDNADRGFWTTNAPAFHTFAEWLRQPVPTPTNPNEPRGLGMILLVDQAKLAYETNSAMTNVLAATLADLQTALNQASAWTTIVQTPTP